MNKELAVIDEHSLVMNDLKKSKELCMVLMQSPHYAKMGEAGVFAISQKAKSIGYNVLDALNGAFYYVNGRVGMGSETMAAIIRSKGHSIVKDPKSNDNCCILHGKRVDNGDTWTIKFDIEDAKRAGIYKNTWNSYPPAMCYNRAMAFMARQLFPDVIKNAGYLQEELEEIEHEEVCPPKVQEVEKLSKEQAAEIETLLAGCAQEYRERYMNYLKDTKIEAIADLPKTAFDKFKLWAIKGKAENEKNMLKSPDINPPMEEEKNEPAENDS